MTKITAIILCLLAIDLFAQTGKPKIIFDTDIGPDYDDVGALAMLHAFTDRGDCELLGTNASNNHPRIVPVLSVINTYFKRPDLPVGMVRGASVELPAAQKWDSLIVKDYPHRLRSNDDALNAIVLYRKILSQQPDTSVTIVTVGFLTNMANLIGSPPDDISPLDGKSLIAKKVKCLVSMAGAFPTGKEFNIEKDAKSAKITFEQWPTKIFFTGWEIGAKIFSGLPLSRSSIKKSPVKDVFVKCIPMSREDAAGRKSWDQTAVLIAVHGPEQFYTLVPGRIVCEPDGRNGWDTAATGQFYVVEKIPSTTVENLINKLMLHTPR
jgi:inosine-uridine nucleoside N-ribohydrolase